MYPFVGSWTEETGLQFEYDHSYDFDTPLFGLQPEWNGEGPGQDGVLKDASGYFELRVTQGRPDTFGMSTLPGSIGFTPTACGWPNTHPYNSLGMFCADIAVQSFYAAPIADVYAEITKVQPDVGYFGYRFPFGTGADPGSVLPDTCGIGEPSDLAGGLWSYGDFTHLASVTEQWTMEFAGGAFSFQGRLVAYEDEFPEVCGDLIDNNCNGYVDDGCAGGECCDVRFTGPTGSLQTEPCPSVAACLSGESCVAYACDISSIVEVPGQCIPDSVPTSELPPCE